MLDRLTPYASPMRSVLRVVAGLLFLQHGLQKLLHWPPGGHPVAIPEGLFTLIGVAGMMEMVFAPLLVMGLYSRLCAFILSGEMAVAYFWIHLRVGLKKYPQAGWMPVVNDGELAIVYCFVFLYLACAGPGLWSLDHVYRPETRPDPRTPLQ